MNFYPNYNQFYGQSFQQPMQNIQQGMQTMPQMQPMQKPLEQQGYISNQSFKTNLGLQGKSVDSVDVVKAMDIPLDGSVSYFPLTDGTAIVTKQLMQDGTSKTITYKPVPEQKDVQNEQEVPKYLTLDEFNKSIRVLDNSGLKEQINSLQDQMENILSEIKDIKDNSNNNYKRK